MSVRIINADVMEGLSQLPDESVHCVVTSPPYWGLRDYGVAGQLGLEPTLGEHIEAMTVVFRDVRRVLRKDGTLWLNYGDSYASSGLKGSGGTGNAYADKLRIKGNENYKAFEPIKFGFDGLKPKDLCGVPWRIAFALQADGWWLRQDIIWSKPNPMPESIKDRCTKAHEYLFLLAKSERYYFDAEAIAEAIADSSQERLTQPNLKNQKGSERAHAGGKTNGAMKAVGTPRNDGSRWNENDGRGFITGGTRNKRSVWEVPTAPFSEAHFATFPPALIEPCIKAGCPPEGTVLDPFGGSGTTGLVADRLKRNAILIELNPTYAAMAQKRIANDNPLFTEVSVA
jgi:DNA modification methylase